MSRSILMLAMVCLVGPLRAQVPEVLYLKFNEGWPSLTTSDDSLVGLPGLNLTPSASFLGWGNGHLGASNFLKLSAWDANWILSTPIQVSGDWTIECWLRTTTSATVNTTFIADASSGGFAIALGSPFIDSDDLRMTGSFGELVLDHARVPGSWVHVAVVNDVSEGTMTPYVDGVAGVPLLPTGTTDLMGTVPGLFQLGFGWTGEMDELRIWDRARTASEIQAFMNTELSAVANDLTVSAIRSPVFLPHATQLLGSAEVVTCEIMNVGTSPIAAGTPVQLSFAVNGGGPVTEMLTLAQALAPGDQLPFTFLASADLSGTGPQSIALTATMAGDQNVGNDQRERSFGGSYGYLVNELPWSEDFEGVPGDYDQMWMSHFFQEDENGSGHPIAAAHDWTFTDASPPYLMAGQNGYSARARASSIAALSALRSPLLDLRQVGNPRLRLRIHADLAGQTNTLPSEFSLDVVSQPGEVITGDVHGPIQDLGPGWHDLQLDLSAFAGQVIQLRFRVSGTPQPLNGHYIHIDDLLLTDHQIGPGQAPQPGLAVFDLNDAMNVGMNDVAYGEPGPYFSAASPGDPMLFSFEGGAMQPVMLLAGPFNPVAATFAGIGQLDIGGPVDPATGIPVGIVVLFDGNQPGGFNGFFVTDGSGQASFGFALPAFPAGPLATFQAVLRDPMTGLFVIGNAIELTVN